MNVVTRKSLCVFAALAVACPAILTLAMAQAAVGSTAPAAAASVPKGFKANSITWLSPQRGWVLGAARCGTKICSDVIGTTDGAKTWGLVGAVNAPIAT